jgi:glycosyltransferase involved in cell wall biosynthesis
MNDVTIIIPTADEELNIGRLLKNLQEYSLLYSEIIVVDHSSDHTPEIANALGARVIIEARAGKGVALLRGLREARTEYVVIMDADGSHRPSELPGVVAALRSGCDVAKGSRFVPGGGSKDLTPSRIFFNWLFTRIVNSLFGAKLTDLCYGYIGVRHALIDRISLGARGSAFDIELLVRAVCAKFIVREIPSFELARTDGPPRVRVITAGFEVLAIIFREAFGNRMRRFIESRMRHYRQLRE